MTPKKSFMYEVTLRRDVQQVTRVRVQAFKRQEAIDAAIAVSAEDDAWNIEESLGTHPPQVQLLRETPIVAKGKRPAT